MVESLSDTKLCLLCNDNSTKVTLPCSHELCQTCISRMEENQDCKCPFCTKPWKATAVNQSKVLDNYKKVEKFNWEVHCRTHQKAVYFWCKDCSLLTCIECVPKTHKLHDFDTIEESYPTTKDLIKTEVAERNSELTDEIKDINNKIENENENIAEIQRLQEKLETEKMKMLKRVEELKTAVTKRHEHIVKLSNVNSYLDEKIADRYAPVIKTCQDLLVDSAMEVPDLPEFSVHKILGLEHVSINLIYQMVVILVIFLEKKFLVR